MMQANDHREKHVADEWLHPWSPVRLARKVIFLGSLLPAIILGHNILWIPSELGANPAQAVEHIMGDWCLNFLLLTLAVTPLRRLTGWNQLIKFRRMLGLFAFFYGVLHLLAYTAFDHSFRLDAIIEDVTRRPFIMAGMAAFLLMSLLALTSTQGWIKRLGKNWRRLHRFIYVIAILGVFHYWLLVKADVTWPAIYGLILFVLLAMRIRFDRQPSAG
jgi:Predicted membrane protein